MHVRLLRFAILQSLQTRQTHPCVWPSPENCYAIFMSGSARLRYVPNEHDYITFHNFVCMGPHACTSAALCNPAKLADPPNTSVCLAFAGKLLRNFYVRLSQAALRPE